MTTLQKRWFHATTKKGWKEIQEEGVLWGAAYRGERETYLARNIEELINFISGPVSNVVGDLRKCQLVLSVKYTPNGVDDDFNPKSWEMVVKKPITLDKVRLIRYL